MSIEAMPAFTAGVIRSVWRFRSRIGPGYSKNSSFKRAHYRNPYSSAPSRSAKFFFEISFIPSASPYPPSLDSWIPGFLLQFKLHERRA